ncbi:glycosyltransferase family 10 [Brachyspira intermedia]|uniref:glycosyltransferase family 10 domain-containing protein n=1 Tax=Brachyspira intermedia TaxID=84377 RepID=UPI003006C71F
MNDYKKIIDKVLWWIPFRNIRNLFKLIFYNILDISELKNKINKLELELIEYKKEYRLVNKSLYKNIYFVRHVNFWDSLYSDDSFYHIIKLILNKYNKDLLIDRNHANIELYSVFGSKNEIKKSDAQIKIFYTGEANTRYKEYDDNCLELCDLCIGFNHIDNEKYIRFPLWIIYYFDIVNLNKDDILQKVNDINNAKFEKTKFASLVSTWGGINNLRKKIYNAVSKIDNISCPSSFLHNDDSLKNQFNDDKYEYLKQFKFNICSENCIEDGYVTEKLFDAFNAGCIPIWNGDKNLEYDVINKNAVLYWQENSKNEDILKEIKLLHKNDDLYNKFVSQPRFNTDNATEYIYGQIKLLHEKIEELLCKKFNL